VSAAIGVGIEENGTHGAAVYDERGIVVETKDSLEERTGFVRIE
jgi:hypothetical protein